MNRHRDRRRCTICKCGGHDRRNCPQRQCSQTTTCLAIWRPLSPYILRHIVGYINASIDDLEPARTMARLALTSKMNMQCIMLEALWRPLLANLTGRIRFMGADSTIEGLDTRNARRIGCMPLAEITDERGSLEGAASAAASRNGIASTPSHRRLATWLTRCCVHCRARYSNVHASLKVRMCVDCANKTVGLVTNKAAIREFRVTESMLQTLEFTTRRWYRGEMKLFVRRHVIKLQNQRFDSKIALTAYIAAHAPYQKGTLYNSSLIR